MRAIEATALQAYAHTPTHRRRVEAAERGLDAFLDRSNAPIVAFSGGKDSTVILDLARQRIPSLPALYADESPFVLPETRAYVDGIPRLVRLAVTKVLFSVQGRTSYQWPHLDRYLPPDTHWYDGRSLPRGRARSIQWCVEHGYDGQIVGLRASENARRRMLLGRVGECHTTRDGRHCAYPLAQWSTRDVWAYIVARGLPYNAAYDVMRAHDVPEPRQRIGPCCDARAIRGGAVEVLRQLWPETWSAIVRAYPDMALMAVIGAG